MPVLEMREVAASVNDYSNEFGSLEETSLYPEYFVWIKNRWTYTPTKILDGMKKSARYGPWTFMKRAPEVAPVDAERIRAESKRHSLSPIPPSSGPLIRFGKRRSRPWRKSMGDDLDDGDGVFRQPRQIRAVPLLLT